MLWFELFFDSKIFNQTSFIFISFVEVDYHNLKPATKENENQTSWTFFKPNKHLNHNILAYPLDQLRG